MELNRNQKEEVEGAPRHWKTQVEVVEEVAHRLQKNLEEEVVEVVQIQAVVVEEVVRHQLKNMEEVVVEEEGHHQLKNPEEVVVEEEDHYRRILVEVEEEVGQN